MLPAALGIGISPLPIVAVVLMLTTPRGHTNGPAFVAGWWLGLGVLGTLVLVIVGNSAVSSGGARADWVNWVFLVLGLLLIGLAAKQWGGRPQGDEVAPTPKWMGSLDHFTALKSVTGGIVLSAVNPKNFLLTLSGAATIAGTEISGGQEAVAYVIFVAIASIGVVVPVVIYFTMGERAEDILAGIKNWMARNNAVIMAVLLLVIGVKLIGDAISGFSA
jgi:threonine/homoserine/homoserine lactone efflux protein